ncbi:septum formation inhibitor Maf [Candidatus Nomurabacteria bacterium]|nr:septum formation inhibitor Maf [Candidatus Nomurabacteria bacterium]
MKKLILASSSSTRKNLLTEAGLNFEIDPSSYEEDITLLMSPKELVAHLSYGKAKDVASRHQEAIVLGADTIIVYQDKILGKPHTSERAKEMLKMLSGRAHLVVTGFTIIDTKNNHSISKVVETEVFFKNLTDREIDNYVATGEPLNKAGAYAILENGGKFVKKIEGSRTNVSGLPMEELMNVLKNSHRSDLWDVL